MKNWEGINGKKYVYLAEECKTTNDDSIEIILPQFQKCEVGYIERDEIMLVVSDGEYDGMDLYYYTNKDKAEELLTDDELKLINISETKIRKELHEIAKCIESLKETPSDDLKFIYRVIKDRLN